MSDPGCKYFTRRAKISQKSLLSLWAIPCKVSISGNPGQNAGLPQHAYTLAPKQEEELLGVKELFGGRRCVPPPHPSQTDSEPSLQPPASCRNQGRRSPYCQHKRISTCVDGEGHLGLLPHPLQVTGSGRGGVLQRLQSLGKSTDYIAVSLGLVRESEEHAWGAFPPSHILICLFSALSSLNNHGIRF